MTLLFEASVLLAAFDAEDANHEPARLLLEDPSYTLATIDLIRYEVTNVAIRAWRSPDWVAMLLAAIDRIGDDGGVLAPTTSRLIRAAELAEEHGISVYDAAYVAAATELGHGLVSCDERDLVSRELATPPARALSA
jgi:predicted nucleic acid-binding protein